ncbi:MAG: hypothetical protein KZQ95_15270 [Candidatus Thiodiazotropha sp. (ex Epidulcina cf. delphinae)]|nr:hypothetical protein [Candidatus Thiodiazotropha sp. (ex Epidulcina cf. delphinae)]
MLPILLALAVDGFYISDREFKTMKYILILWNIIFLLSSSAASMADEYNSVFPSFLDLTLNEGEMAIEQVSLTIHPFCIRPVYVDVIASDPSALAKNLTGVVVNGCGGDTSTFDIEFTGAASPQHFELQFVDSEFGGVLAAIPVSISPMPKPEPLLGVLFRKYGIVFQVASSGCTQKSDFRVEVMESFPLQLRLIRVQQDPCDAFVPLGERIHFSYRELGIVPGDELRVLNPLGTVVVPF